MEFGEYLIKFIHQTTHFALKMDVALICKYVYSFGGGLGVKVCGMRGRVNMVIMLFGVTNVGKTVTGNRLAEKLGYSFFDLDDEINIIFR